MPERILPPGEDGPEPGKLRPLAAALVDLVQALLAEEDEEQREERAA